MNLANIKKICESRQIAIKHLADKVGTSEQNLHRCIRVNKIQAEILENIAKTLHVSVLEFFDEELIPVSNNATAIGIGSTASVQGDVSASLCPEPATQSEDSRVLNERIKGLEALVSELKEMINILREQGK